MRLLLKLFQIKSQPGIPYESVAYKKSIQRLCFLCSLLNMTYKLTTSAKQEKRKVAKLK